MRLWRSMLAMLLCSGLIIAFGITACGDDDDEESGMTCEEALSTLTSTSCIEAVEDALPGVQNCLGGCTPGNDVCIDNCLDLDALLPSSCAQAIGMLMDEDDAVCGGCYVACGQVFVNCVVAGGQGTCLIQLGACVPTCNTP